VSRDYSEDYPGQYITGPDFDTRDREGREPEPLQPLPKWLQVETGGGCTAWRRNIDDGYLLLTSLAEDCCAPQHAADEVLMGVYSEDECQLVRIYCANVVEADRLAGNIAVNR
jgi:hypothetical protein